MSAEILQPTLGEVLALAAAQHGVVSRTQLLRLGFNERAIRHRVRRGRLHTLWRGVYAVGRPQLSPRGRWMAAVLACGPEAALSHRSAAHLLGVLDAPQPLVGDRLGVAGGGAVVDISVPVGRNPDRPGIRIHRRAAFETGTCHLIPVTDPVCTLVDLATTLTAAKLEAAVNEADKLDLVDPETLRSALERLSRRPGIAPCGGCSTGRPSPSPTPSWSGASCGSSAASDCRDRRPAGR